MQGKAFTAFKEPEVSELNVEIDADPQSRTHVVRYEENTKKSEKHENSQRHAEILIHLNKGDKNSNIVIKDSEENLRKEQNSTKVNGDKKFRKVQENKKQNKKFSDEQEEKEKMLEKPLKTKLEEGKSEEKLKIKQKSQKLFQPDHKTDKEKGDIVRVGSKNENIDQNAVENSHKKQNGYPQQNLIHEGTLPSITHTLHDEEILSETTDHNLNPTTTSHAVHHEEIKMTAGDNEIHENSSPLDSSLKRLPKEHPIDNSNRATGMLKKEEPNNLKLHAEKNTNFSHEESETRDKSGKPSLLEAQRMQMLLQGPHQLYHNQSNPLDVHNMDNTVEGNLPVVHHQYSQMHLSIEHQSVAPSAMPLSLDHENNSPGHIPSANRKLTPGKDLEGSLEQPGSGLPVEHVGMDSPPIHVDENGRSLSAPELVSHIVPVDESTSHIMLEESLHTDSSNTEHIAQIPENTIHETHVLNTGTSSSTQTQRIYTPTRHHSTDNQDDLTHPVLTDKELDTPAREHQAHSSHITVSDQQFSSFQEPVNVIQNSIHAYPDTDKKEIKNPGIGLQDAHTDNDGASLEYNQMLPLTHQPVTPNKIHSLSAEVEPDTHMGASHISHTKHVLTIQPGGIQQEVFSHQIHHQPFQHMVADNNAPMRVTCAHSETSSSGFDCIESVNAIKPFISFEGPNPADISLFQLSALNSHNAYRYTHEVEPMRLNQDMSKEATEYAKRIAKLGTLKHSGTEDGENIATVCRDKNILMTGPEASTIWYREVCDPGYDFVTGQPGKAGHFTQVIWGDSKEFGIGRAAEMHDGLLCTYIVARYRPAGNFLGEFAQNVPRGHFQSQQCVNLARKNEIITSPRKLHKRSGIPRIRPARLMNNSTEINFVPSAQDFVMSPDALIRRGKRDASTKVVNSSKHLVKSSRASTSRNVNKKRMLSPQQMKVKIRYHRKTFGLHRIDNILESKPYKRMKVKKGSLNNKRKIKATKSEKKHIKLSRYAHKKHVVKSAMRNRKMNKILHGSRDKKKSTPSKQLQRKEKILQRTKPKKEIKGKISKKTAVRKKTTSRKVSPSKKLNQKIASAHKKDETPHHVIIPESSLSKLIDPSISKGKGYEISPDSQKSSVIVSNNEKIQDPIKENTNLEVTNNKILEPQNHSLQNQQILMRNSTKLSKPIFDGAGQKREIDVSANNLDSTKIEQDSPESIVMNELKGGLFEPEAFHNEESGLYKADPVITVNAEEDLHALEKSTTESKSSIQNPGESKTAINSHLSELALGKSKTSVLKSILHESQSNPTEKISTDDNKSSPLFAGGSISLVAQSRHIATKTPKMENATQDDVGNVVNIFDDKTNAYNNRQVKVKFIEHTGVITPLPRSFKKANKRVVNKTVGSAFKAQPYNLFTYQGSLQPNPPVLSQNPASVAVAQMIGNDFYEGSKEHDENKNLLAMSSIAESAKLPTDLLLGRNHVKGTENVLKLAKIGTIALQLAKKKAIQQRIMESIGASHLQGVDLLKHLQEAHNQNEVLAPQDITSPNLLVSSFAMASQPPQLAGNMVGLLENDMTKSKTGIECGNKKNCMNNPAAITDVKNQLRGIAKQAAMNILNGTDASLANHTTSSVTQTNQNLDQSNLNGNAEPFSTLNNSTSNKNETTKSDQLGTVISTNDPATLAIASGKPASERLMPPQGSVTPIEELPRYLETEFEEASLNAHNAFRSVHDIDPLVLDQKLSMVARERAQNIASVGTFQQQSTDTNKEGENVAMVCKDAAKREKMTGPDAVMKWYNQVCFPEYVFAVERPQRDADQFVQVVWKETSKLGIGRSTFEKNGNYCTVIVARYSPGANFGVIKDNVPQGSFDHGAYCNGLGSVVDIGSTSHTRSSAAEAGISENTQDFRQEALNLANEFRAVHGTPSMGLDDNLCIAAELYATKLAKDSSTKHSDTDDGESIIKRCNMNTLEMSADEAIRKWYNEVCNPGYSFVSDQPAGGTSSFTQMVWKPTSLFGIGKATSNESGMMCVYIVARYRVKGNSPGGFKLNVPKGAFDFGYCESLGKTHRRSYNRGGYKRNSVTTNKVNQSEMNMLTAGYKRTLVTEEQNKNIVRSNSIKIHIQKQRLKKRHGHPQRTHKKRHHKRLRHSLSKKSQLLIKEFSPEPSVQIKNTLEPGVKLFYQSNLQKKSNISSGLKRSYQTNLPESKNVSSGVKNRTLNTTTTTAGNLGNNSINIQDTNISVNQFSPSISRDNVSTNNNQQNITTLDNLMISANSILKDNETLNSLQGDLMKENKTNIKMNGNEESIVLKKNDSDVVQNKTQQITVQNDAQQNIMQNNTQQNTVKNNAQKNKVQNNTQQNTMPNNTIQNTGLSYKNSSADLMEPKTSKFLIDSNVFNFMDDNEPVKPLLNSSSKQNKTFSVANSSFVANVLNNSAAQLLTNNSLVGDLMQKDNFLQNTSNLAYQNASIKTEKMADIMTQQKNIPSNSSTIIKQDEVQNQRSNLDENTSHISRRNIKQIRRFKSSDFSEFDDLMGINDDLETVGHLMKFNEEARVRNTKSNLKIRKRSTIIEKPTNT